MIFQVVILAIIVDLLLVAWIASLVRLYGLSFFEEMRWYGDYQIGNSVLILIGVCLALGGSATVALADPSLIGEPLSSNDIVFAVFAVALAPLLEELIVRGFLYRVLEDLAGMLTAVSISAIVYALFHLPQDWPELSVLLTLGFVLSWLRSRTDSLIPCVVVHTSYNSTLALLSFLVGHTPSFS